MYNKELSELNKTRSALVDLCFAPIAFILFMVTYLSLNLIDNMLYKESINGHLVLVESLNGSEWQTFVFNYPASLIIMSFAYIYIIINSIFESSLFKKEKFKNGKTKKSFLLMFLFLISMSSILNYIISVREDLSSIQFSFALLYTFGAVKFVMILLDLIKNIKLYINFLKEPKSYENIGLKIKKLTLKKQKLNEVK